MNMPFENVLRPVEEVKRHWAANYVGKPWAAGAEGPYSFDCWGLVRSVFRTQLNYEMPVIQLNVPQPENVASIRRSAEEKGWVQVEITQQAPLRQFDIVLMRNTYGRHVGVVVVDGRRTAVLHASGFSLDDGTAMGNVAFQTITELSNYGFHGFEYWRKADLNNA